MTPPPSNPPDIRSQIEEGMHPRWRRVDADLIDALVASVAEWVSTPRPAPRDVARALIVELLRTRDQLEDLREDHQAFSQRHSVMRTEPEIRENILAYAAELGAGPRQLRGDRRAFRRYFGYDAMGARYQRRDGECQRKLAFILERLGGVARRALSEADAPNILWRDLDLEPLLSAWLHTDLDARVGVAALRCLTRSIEGLPESMRISALGLETSQSIYRLALDTERDIWMQCEALALLGAYAPLTFDQVARLRYESPIPAGDDLFVRRRLVPLVVARPKLRDLVDVILHDPSPFVRQALAGGLPQLAPDQAIPLLEQFLGYEEVPPVRAAALLQVPALAAATAGETNQLAGLLHPLLESEADPYVLRVAIHVAAESHAALSGSHRVAWRDTILPVLRRVHQANPSLPARRWAALARERIWCDADPERIALLRRVRETARATPPGKAAVLRDTTAAALDDESLGRVLSVAAQDDFGFDVVRRPDGIRLIRGHRFGFRFWRFFHEWRHPSPDKRQAFRHTIGRIFEGPLRVPSALLSEMSQTKVPGEPLTLASEGGWRPFLPLVDDLLSALEENGSDQPLKLVTSEGITVVRPPRSRAQRLRAHWTLTRRFEEFSRLRNAGDPSAYIARLRGLGLSCDFAAAAGEELEPHAARWYAGSNLPVLAFAPPELWAPARDYFYSIYGNSLGQLFAFLAAATAYLGGRHLYANQVFYRHRRSIPLVVGGWGTRGKSGTERIKAALFNALGHRIVSKTTGCEAMFLYADTFGKLHELFLFRPYDKATIWEQVHILNLAARLRSHVFLWECMGLKPDYIEIIQRHWMKDDLSTIVNTYPDHEDVQGPAGVNIPQVMTYFVRKGGHLLTSEQQMTPILEAEAHRVHCRVDKVGWIEPGLLTADILDRFPYAEHPNNIALVAELGAQLGMPCDFCLKEMADRVVPDLGVLKVYPVAQLAGRRLQFVNGCSANERFGTLGNWRRLGFDQHNPREEPGQWITAVVNNRADRVARSRVFANIVVEDIAVDRLFLIGTNLPGLVGYIREALDEHLASLTLFPKEGPSPEEVLRQTTHRWRLPASPEERDQTLAAIEGDVDLSPWREPWQTAYAEYEAFAATLRAKVDPARADAAFRALLRTWFERKVVVMHDAHSTGDQIIDRIARETPPGYLNRIMGLQNIKGTGLDFVYRWQAWDICCRACEQLIDRKPKIAREGIATLVAFKEFGLLCEDAVLQAIRESGARYGIRDPAFQAQLQHVQENLESSLAAIKAGLTAADRHRGWKDRLVGGAFHVLESLLDAGDAVRRRKKADQVYRDMAAERISPARAALEVQLLNKRQKGGWLKQDLAAGKVRREARRH